jgi:hypothetical protein
MQKNFPDYAACPAMAQVGVPDQGFFPHSNRMDADKHRCIMLCHLA